MGRLFSEGQFDLFGHLRSLIVVKASTPNVSYWRPIALLLLLCTLGLPAASAQQGPRVDAPRVGTTTGPLDSSRARVFRWMYRDVGALARNVTTPKFALYATGTMAGTLGLAWLDDDAGDAVGSVYHGTFKDALDVVDYLGGPKINYPVIALAGGSLLTNNLRFQDAAFTSLQTLIYAGLIGYGLKGIFGRERPEWSDNTYAFFSRTGKNPFSHEGNSSFPGGHAIAAFGIITPWVMYYPSPVTYALYILPVGTGISRVAGNKHWATDIAVGAFIGISMGRWLSRLHQNAQRRDERLDLSVLEDGNLFRITFSFDSRHKHGHAKGRR